MCTVKPQVTNSHIYRYGIICFMFYTGSGMALQYINIFMTDYLMISAVTVSTALLVAKFIDLLTSCVAGGIVEKLTFKNNQYIGWFRIIRWVLLIGFALAFLNTNSLGISSEVVRAGIVALGYVVFGAGMSFLIISISGVNQIMSGPDMALRSRFSAKAAQGQASSQIVVAAVVIPALGLFAPLVGEGNSYFVVCVGLYMVSFIGSFLMVRLIKPFDTEGRHAAGAAKPKVTAKDMVKSVVTNRQLLLIIIAFMLYYTAQYVLTTIQAYYFRYVINDYGYMSTSMTIRTAFAFVAALFIPKLGMKLCKKKSLVVGLIVYGIGMLGITFLGLYSKHLFTLSSCLFTAAMYLFIGFGVNYFLDCGEYGYYKTGKDNRAIAMSMYNIPMKIGFMLGGSIASYGLAFLGFEAGMVMTESFINRYMFLIGVVPAVLVAIAALIIHFGYKITDEDAAAYAKANMERK